jgi:hypothetical protein
MRLHKEDGTIRRAVDLLEEFQGRWEWTGELAVMGDWQAVEPQRITSALYSMMDDFRALRRVVHAELGVRDENPPRPMAPLADEPEQ